MILKLYTWRKDSEWGVTTLGAEGLCREGIWTLLIGSETSFDLLIMSVYFRKVINTIMNPHSQCLSARWEKKWKSVLLLWVLQVRVKRLNQLDSVSRVLDRQGRFNLLHFQCLTWKVWSFYTQNVWISGFLFFSVHILILKRKYAL